MTESDDPNSKAVLRRAKKEAWLRIDAILVSPEGAELIDSTLVHPKHHPLVKRYHEKRIDMNTDRYNKYLHDMIGLSDDEAIELDVPVWESEAEEVECLCRPEDDPIFDGELPDKP